MNTIQDATDNLIHSERVQKSLGLLREARNTWDRFVRWTLSFFGLFQDIYFIESLSNGTSTMIHIPEEYLLKWYQRFQDGKFVQERESIRSIMVKTWNG
jgi:hypothetical protein